MSMSLIRSFAITALFLFAPHLAAQQAGEHVSISGEINDDLYLAGGQVDMYATVDGDVVVAGGQLNLEGDVSADVVAAGGDIELRGKVADDARIAGGNIRVLAKIGDDLVVAGGRVQIGSTAEVDGSAWVSAGDVFVDGKIANELHINGGRVIVSGTVGGNVEIWAEQLEVSSSAVITGNLHYSSPHPAMLADGARIEGEIIYTPVDIPVAPFVAGLLLVFIAILVSVMITAVVLYLVFPGVTEDCSNTIREKPWVSLGYGLAVFAGGPVVIILLFSTALGALLALLLLAAYLIILLAGYIAGAYYVADIGMRKLKKDGAGKIARVISLALSIAVLSIVNIIPVIGSLINWFVLLSGVGALKRHMVLAYMAEKK